MNVAKIVVHHGNKRDANSLFLRFVAIEIVAFMCYNSYIRNLVVILFMCKTKAGCLFLLALVAFIGPKNVWAASSCSYEDQVKLSAEANNVRTTYEIKEILTGNQIEADDGSGMEDETYIGAEVNIYNLTENLYVVVTDSKDDSQTEYYYGDTDNGTIKFLRGNDGLTDIVTYHVSVRSNIADCKGEEYYSVDIVTPMYNYFSSEPLCANSDKYYCQEYITQDLNMSYADFVKQATRDQESTEQEEKENNEEKNDLTSKIVLYTTIGLIVLIIGVATFVIVRKKQRSSVK